MANAAFIPLPGNSKQIYEQSYLLLNYDIILGYGVLNYWYLLSLSVSFQLYRRGHSSRDCMVAGFTTTYAIGAYHH